MYCIIIYVQHKICFSPLHSVWHTYLYYKATNVPPNSITGRTLTMLFEGVCKVSNNIQMNVYRTLKIIYITGVQSILNIWTTSSVILSQ